MAESDETDMTHPVTRGELREEFARFEKRLEEKLEKKLEEKLDEKLKLWAGALNDRIERGEARIISEVTAQVTAQVTARVTAETTRHINAIWEATRAQIAVIDDKYTDLPTRVARLEAQVFAVPPRPRRRKLKG